MTGMERPGTGTRGGNAHLLPFASRESAGELLARRLLHLRGQHPIVLGIPRGGVAVAAPIAAALDADLDVLVTRRLGAPGQPEVSIGAVTADGETWLDTALAVRLRVTPKYLETVTHAEQVEAQRREQRFRGVGERPALRGRIAVLVDDGMATGATMLAAIHALRRSQPARVVVAVPVGTQDACRALTSEADEVACLAQPDPFFGVGVHYWNFPRLADDDVELLLRSRVRSPGAPAPPPEEAPRR